MKTPKFETVLRCNSIRCLVHRSLRLSPYRWQIWWKVKQQRKREGGGVFSEEGYPYPVYTDFSGVSTLYQRGGTTPQAPRRWVSFLGTGMLKAMDSEVFIAYPSRPPNIGRPSRDAVELVR